MALQEKEFVVKNGLDIKNSKLKLNSVAATNYQIPLQKSDGTLGWANIQSGQGIVLTTTDTQIVVSSSGTIPGTITNVGDLNVGVSSTWTSSGTNITVTYASHGLVATNLVYLIWSGTVKPSDGYYTVAKAALDSFTIVNAVAASVTPQSCSIGGNITAKRSLTVDLNASIGTTLTVGSTASIGTSLTITGTPSIIADTAGSTVSIFNTSTGNVNIANSASVVSIGSSASATNLNGTLSHKGLTFTAGVAANQKVDTLYTFSTASIILSSAWSDTGISGATQLASGVYSFKMQIGSTNEFYYGELPWYSGNGSATINDEFTEIAMYKIGDGGTANSIFIRVYRTVSAAPKVQLASSSTLSSLVFNFSFRKLID